MLSSVRNVVKSIWTLPIIIIISYFLLLIFMLLCISPFMGCLLCVTYYTNTFTWISLIYMGFLSSPFLQSREQRPGSLNNLPMSSSKQIVKLILNTVLTSKPKFILLYQFFIPLLFFCNWIPNFPPTKFYSISWFLWWLKMVSFSMIQSMIPPISCSPPSPLVSSRDRRVSLKAVWQCLLLCYKP